MSIRVVMLGDVVGTPGIQAVKQQLPVIRKHWQPDVILANAENAYNGSGLTPQLYHSLCEAGVQGITLGDHVYKRGQITNIMDSVSNLIRPANLSRQAKGLTWMKLPVGKSRGSTERTHLFVMTVLGRIFCPLPADDPFETVEKILGQLPDLHPIVLVEVHAETTSEKKAMGWFLDGRVAAVIGTHTHVATADAEILPNGTAYITDIGMCGPHESILGRRVDRVLKHMTTSMPAPFDVAEGDPRVCGVFVEIDPGTQKATAIERIELKADPQAPPFRGRELSESPRSESSPNP